MRSIITSKSRRRGVSILGLLLISNQVFSQDLVWVKQLGGTDYNEARAIVVSDNGESYTTGYFGGTMDCDPGPNTLNLTSFGDHDIFVTKLDASGNLIWAKQMGGTSVDEGLSIDIDGSGNAYITGVFYGSGDFDPGTGTTTLSSGNSSNVFICKLDASGNFLWAKQMAAIGSSAVSRGIKVDANNNVYVTGAFWGTIDFDPGSPVYNLTAAGSLNASDIFVSKLDSDGNFVWTKQLGGINADTGLSISIDNTGNVYTAGSFEGTTIDFNPATGPSEVYNLSATGSKDIFVSKLDASGNFVWARQIGGTAVDECNAITVDASGVVHIAGYFQGTVDFDPGTGTSEMVALGSASNVFVSKLDAAGEFVWAKQMGGYAGAKAFAIATDVSNNVYTTGTFAYSADFDPGTGTFNLASIDNTQDVFVSKLDASGNFVWAKSFGGSNADEGHALAADDNGNVYSAGYFWQTVDFDPGSGEYILTSLGAYDAFIHKMGSSVTAIDESAIGSSMVYPNPASTSVTIALSQLKEGSANLNIINVTGQQVLNLELKSSVSTVEIDQLNPGVYFYQVIQDHRAIVSGKLLIE